MSVNRACTVCRLESCLIVTLDCTLEALTFAYAAYVNCIAYCKYISLKYIAYINCTAVIKSEFLKCLLAGNISLLEVTL